jgi:hypothetical protein
VGPVVSIRAVEVTELSREEGRALLDRAARDLLGISGEEFLRRWDAGGYEADRDRCEPDVTELAMLIPFAREVSGDGRR